MLISSAVFAVAFVSLRLLNIICFRQKVINNFYNAAIKRVYFAWTLVNEVMILYFLKIDIKLPDLTEINKDEWHLITSNHQGFFDILVIQIICRRKGLYNKFFMKESLIFMPFIGISCWGLDFVFIKRFAKKILKEQPEKIKKQHQYILEKCSYFRTYPCSVINFIEGTRYTKEKAARSSYNNLLSPQPMGLSLLITEFYKQAKKIIDISIIYPEKHGFFDLIYGESVTINVFCNIHPIDSALAGDYRHDKNYRKIFSGWIKQLWQQKDQEITKVKQQLRDRT